MPGRQGACWELRSAGGEGERVSGRLRSLAGAGTLWAGWHELRGRCSGVHAQWWKVFVSSNSLVFYVCLPRIGEVWFVVAVCIYVLNKTGGLGMATKGEKRPCGGVQCLEGRAKL